MVTQNNCGVVFSISYINVQLYYWSNPLFLMFVYLQMPITPQANLPPALPVVLLSSWPPFPRSSTSACTTTVLPKMLLSPVSDMNLSVMSIAAFPLSSAITFPKSPAWRDPLASSGAPCVHPSGLKWGPADVQPSVLSPNWCIWKPCCPGARPSIWPVTFTASPWILSQRRCQ